MVFHRDDVLHEVNSHKVEDKGCSTVDHQDVLQKQIENMVKI